MEKSQAPIKFDHQSWRDTLRELQQAREMAARVCASFVLDGDWKLATKLAQEYRVLTAAVNAHLDLLPDQEAPETDK